MSNINPKLKEAIEWAYCILIAVILALLVRYYLGTPTIVKQPSMFPTLEQDQRLLLSRWGRTTKKLPQRGEIITFEAPSTTRVSEREFNALNPIAKYETDPKGFFSRFIYFVLELGKTSYIKRVIATPGEHIQIKDEKVYIDGEELDEPYLQEGVITENLKGLFKELIVPENCVFVMGDNREKSADSRMFGCIPLERIESKVILRFWPFSKWGKVE